MSSSTNGGSGDYDEESFPQDKDTYLVRLPSIYEIIRYPLEIYVLALDIKALVARYQLWSN